MIDRKLLAILLAATLAGCSSTTEPAALTAAAAPVAAVQPPSPQGRVAAVLATPPQPAAPGPQGVGNVVYFDYDSAAIRPEFQDLLAAHARYLRGRAGTGMVVEGHTDERGGREYNLALGQQRSDAVRKVLGLLGASPASVETVSFGEEKPVAVGHDESGWSRNRRALIRYSK
ncbi:MAG: OmpA family protein [Burkholderiales bacterium]|nr:OmpA family protein [Burkholderiales bacterium]